MFLSFYSKVCVLKTLTEKTSTEAIKDGSNAVPAVKLDSECTSVHHHSDVSNDVTRGCDDVTTTDADAKETTPDAHVIGNYEYRILPDELRCLILFIAR